MKNWLAKIIAGLLLLGVAGTSSGCLFTAQALVSARTTLERDEVAIRVQHCYLNQQGQIVVAAEGGVIGEFNYATTGLSKVVPRDPVWFQVDYVTLAQKAPHGILKLGEEEVTPVKRDANGNAILEKGYYAFEMPLDTLKPGTPDLDKLKQEGFVEVPFRENDYMPSYRVPNPPGGSNVRIDYDSMYKMANFPDRLGIGPWFFVSDATTQQRYPFTLEYDHMQNHVMYVFAVPFTLALDAVTSPFQIWYIFFSHID